ncbi:MAG: hypothetical protein IKC08_02125, partial [Lentisphaeria bacterium]|nr:hypothetical protein [Lentisphaeria bacterium]
MDCCKIYTGMSSLVDGTVKEYLFAEKSQELFSAKVSSSIVDGIENIRSTFVAGKNIDGRFFIDLEFPAYQDDWFIFIPSACYDGNRFTLIPESPMKLFVVDFVPEDPLDPPVTMLELPSLNNGFNRQITDGSAPVLGIWKKNENEAIFLSFEQGT